MLHRWKGPEAEGEGEEPVVNQNRRSTESPSHLSETVRGPVCVEIVARDLAAGERIKIDRSIGVKVAAVLVIVIVAYDRAQVDRDDDAGGGE